MGPGITSDSLSDFVDPAPAQERLRELAKVGGEALASRCLAAARAAGETDHALAGLTRIILARHELGIGPGTDQALAVAAALGAASDLFPVVVSQRPRWLEWLSAPQVLHSAPKTPAQYDRELGQRLNRLGPDPDDEGLHRALRIYKCRELVRIATRDLLGTASAPALMGELSHLAACCVDAAYRAIDQRLRRRRGAPAGCPEPGQGFCILGMGKLGGGELNFSSDIDLIYVYGQDGETAGGEEGAVANRELFSRLAEELTRAIGADTDDGRVFRVDLNLRPDGRNGPIVCSAEAMEEYYESYGRTWERTALLKARAVAGDRVLGERVLQDLAPFIWRRSLDAAQIEEMRVMKARVHQHSGGRDEDVKLGPGGIREVEFFIQALQLLHGGKNPRLRDRSTLNALASALFAGLITAKDCDALSDAYLFLRRVEHRLQMIDDRQTHTLPEAPRARLRIARGLGFPTLESFETTLSRHRAAVHAIFEDILCASGMVPSPMDPVLAVAADAQAADEARRSALWTRGFVATDDALEAVRRLGRDPTSPFARRPGPAPEAVRLLADCAASPDPDQSLFHLSAFFASLRTPGPFYELLGRHPATGRLLASLFGTSDFLSKELLRHPELLDTLLGADQANARKGKERLTAELKERLSGLTAREERLGAMRRFKSEEVLRIGVRDVAGELSVDGVHGELSDLADALVAACLDDAYEEALERYGRPVDSTGATAKMAVMGLGSLGAQELGYHSDLDLVFLYSEPGETEGGSRGRASNGELFSWLAQRLLSSLATPLGEGVLYRTDVRLRPSGNQGTLVVSAASFAEHQRARAQTWERQALLKARCVAGDAAFFLALRDEILAPAVFRADLDQALVRQEVLRMRERMERELAHEGRSQVHPKLGRGGLVDIEFLAEYLQLIHGAAHPGVRWAGTRPALAALAAAGVLGAEDAGFLDRAWAFLRRLEARLQIVYDHPLPHMPRAGRALQTLARRMGYAGEDPGRYLRSDYEAMTAAVRRLYEQILA